MDKKGLLRIFDLLCNLYGTAHLLIFRGYGFFFPGNHTEIHHSDGVSVYASVRVFQQRGLSHPDVQAFPDSRIRAHEAFPERPFRPQLPWEYKILMMRPGLQPMIAWTDSHGCWMPERPYSPAPVVLAAARIERGAVHRVRTRILPCRSRGAIRTERGEVAVVAEFFPVVHGVSPCAVQFRNVLGEICCCCWSRSICQTGSGSGSALSCGAQGWDLLAGAAFISRYQVGFALVSDSGSGLLAFARRWRLLAGLALVGAAMLGVRRAGRLLAARAGPGLAGQLPERKYPEFPHR